VGGPDSASAEQFPPFTFWEAWQAKMTDPTKSLPVGWWFPVVLWGSTIMDYVVGLGIGRSQNELRRRAWLLVSIGINLGVLGFFKYYNWGIDSVHAALSWFGLETSKGNLAIFLPYGISFYTFQSMSYSIDVYRRRLEPVTSFLDLAFFISFFPQLVAGPIVRAMTFLPQVFVTRVWSNVNVRACLALFFIGFVKKSCISENVAPLVDAYFAAPDKYDLYSSFIGVAFYAVQIYCDFSGYTDMAIACSRLLGYELTINFDFPYFARSITEFWRKWHISLSTWLRDYLYISLGGNRGSKLFTYRNLMLTMLLGGLWHGAAWTYVIWGGLHGLALIFHREWTERTANFGPRFKQAIAWLAVPLTFYWVCITWVPFRATDLYIDKQSGATALRAGDTFTKAPDQTPLYENAEFIRDAKTRTWRVVDRDDGTELSTIALKASGFQVTATILDSICRFDGQGRRTFAIDCLWLLAALALVHYANSRRWLSTWWQRIPDWAFSALLGAGFAVALFFVPTKYKAFIYFQF
jgi:alginate O-acetyltransferase complex protein AlgI